FFSSRRRHTRFSRDWSSDVCSSDLRMASGQRREWTLMAASREFEITLTAYPEDGAPKSGQTSAMLEAEIDLPYPRKPQHRRGLRSEERRVGNECRARWPQKPWKKKE